MELDVTERDRISLLADKRHLKMHALIARAQPGMVRRRFATAAELLAGAYAEIFRHLEARELLRSGPFETAPCSGATLDDLDAEDMYRFIRIARRARGLPLPLDTPPPDLLRHLNLLNMGRWTKPRCRTSDRPRNAFSFPPRSSARTSSGRRSPSRFPPARGLQGHGVRARGPSGGLRHEQDRALGGHSGGERAGTRRVRDPEGGGDRGDRERGDYTDSGSVQVMDPAEPDQ